MEAINWPLAVFLAFVAGAAVGAREPAPRQGVRRCKTEARP